MTELPAADPRPASKAATLRAVLAKFWARWHPVVWATLILAPAVWLAVLIAEHQVNIPFLDDWMFTPFYEKIARQELTWQDFFVVQMEHRLALPRAVLWVWYHVCPGNFCAQNWLSFALLVLTAWNVGVLLSRAAPSFAQWRLPMLLASLVIFSPIQYQILLWPMMFQVVFLPALLTSMLAAVGTRWPVWLKFALCASCALGATLCLASGLLLWVLLVPVVLWTEALPAGKVRRTFLALWIAAAALTAGLYFHDLRNTTDEAFSYGAEDGESTFRRNFSAVLAEPLRLPAFVLAFLGGHLGRGTSASLLSMAYVLGTLSAGLFALGGGWCLRRWKDPALRAELMPWLMLGAYSIGTGLMVGLGRAWASKSGDNALQARYVIHGMPLTVALIALTWLALRRLNAGECPVWRDRFRLGTAAAVALFLAVQAVVWTHGIQMMGVWESARLRGATNTLFFRVPQLIAPEGQVAGNPSFARRMDDLGLLRPPMVKGTGLSQFTIAPKPLAKNVADFNFLVKLEDQSFRAEGFAALRDRRRVADGVFFTHEEETSGEPQIFHVGQVLEMPLYLGKSLGRDLRFVHQRGRQIEQEELSGFSAEFELTQLPHGKTGSIAAWAFDCREQTVYLIGRYTLNAATGRIKELRTKIRSHWRDRTPK